MSPAEIRALVDRYIDAYNRKDVDDMLAGVHPQVQFKNISAGVVNASINGVAELRILAQQSLSNSGSGLVKQHFQGRFAEPAPTQQYSPSKPRPPRLQTPNENSS